MPEGSVDTLTMTVLSSIYSWTVLSSRDAIFSQLADLRVPFDISWLVYPNGPTETFPAQFSLLSEVHAHNSLPCLFSGRIGTLNRHILCLVKRMCVGLKPLSVFFTGPY